MKTTSASTKIVSLLFLAAVASGASACVIETPDLSRAGDPPREGATADDPVEATGDAKYATSLYGMTKTNPTCGDTGCGALGGVCNANHGKVCACEKKVGGTDCTFRGAACQDNGCSGKGGVCTPLTDTDCVCVVPEPKPDARATTEGFTFEHDSVVADASFVEGRGDCDAPSSFTETVRMSADGKGSFTLASERVTRAGTIDPTGAFVADHEPDEHFVGALDRRGAGSAVVDYRGPNGCTMRWDVRFVPTSS